jgi:hypothetical protein
LEDFSFRRASCLSAELLRDARYRFALAAGFLSVFLTVLAIIKTMQLSKGYQRRKNSLNVARFE